MRTPTILARAWRFGSVVSIGLMLLGGLFAASIAGAQQPAPKSKPAATKPRAKSTEPALKMVLEPRAMDLLRATSARLAAAKTMSFTAVAGFEYPSKLGPAIVYSSRYDVTMQRPDKLRVLMPGDGPASEFYYDGKTMMAYAPAENLVAVADAPSTIDATLKVAYGTAAIYFPFMDLLVSDPYDALTDGATLAFYIGPSTVVGNVKTDMVAWANNDVFMQIWIGTDDKLPRRVRAVYSADPLRLRHELELSNWQLDGPVPSDAFASQKVQAAQRMAFANPTPAVPAGVKPIVKSTPGGAASAKAPTKAKGASQ